MKQLTHPRRWRFVLALALILALLPTTIWAVEAGAGYVVNWRVIANGGIQNSTGGGYALSGTAGQLDASVALPAGGGYAMSGGFWQAGETPEFTGGIYLPLINRTQ